MKQQNVTKNLTALGKLKTKMRGKDFLLTWERTLDEIKATELVAECLKDLHQEGISSRIFDSGLAISIFRDKSTRTRFSFASAADLLGLSVADLDEEVADRPRRDRARDRQHDLVFDRDHRHPR